MVPVLHFLGGQISFTAKYDGNTVTGLVGLSINFTWSFSGDVDAADWGIKRAGLPILENNGILVSVKKNGLVSGTAVPSVYIGRVDGTGNTSFGQVIFTLSSIRKSDERYYGCMLTPTDSFDVLRFDSVYLAVEGN